MKAAPAQLKLLDQVIERARASGALAIRIELGELKFEASFPPQEPKRNVSQDRKELEEETYHSS